MDEPKTKKGARQIPMSEKVYQALKRAVKNRGLERSFKQAIPQEVYERLEKEMDEIG